MSRAAREALLVGFLLAAIPAIGKAFLDIRTLEVKSENNKDILLEIKEDIKFIKRQYGEY
tara:strand:+ start:1148 stop:1327 length:180 start_codon:yes stop_codon:yes gene_type:complete